MNAAIRSRSLGLLLAGILAGTAQPLVAQSAPESPISTDRPGFLFSPLLVPVDRWQVEAGLPTFTRLEPDGGRARLWTLPVAVRYGLSERVELRASLPTWTDAFVEDGGQDSAADGWSDVEVGAKFALDSSSDTPLALQGGVRLPTGSDSFTTDELGGSLYLLHGRPLGGGFGLNTMLGVTYAPIEGGADPLAGAIAALVSRSFAGEWTGYGELSAFPGIQDVAGQAYAGGGLVWTVRPDVQLDLSADFGLDDDAAEVIAALGVSVRW